MEKRRKTRDEKKKKKASFKTIGLYVTIGNHFIKSIKRGQIANDSTTTFDDLFTPRDGFVVEDEKELFKACVTPRPPMSDTMRKIILDLNQCHLIDGNSNTIQEEREEIEQPPLNENQPLKRPKWNNFVDQQIISRQRFLNTFTTDLAFRKEHLAKEKQAEREAVQKKLAHELKLPKVSKTTEDLILRRTNLDSKLQIMKICHQNRLQYKEEFVERTSRSTTSLQQHRKKTMLRSRSWHSTSHPDSRDNIQTRKTFSVK